MAELEQLPYDPERPVRIADAPAERTQGVAMTGFLDASTFAGSWFDGTWRAASGEAYDDRNPATGEVLFSVGAASPADVAEACKVAAAAQPGWAALPAEERAGVLRRAAELFDTHNDEILQWVHRETGAAAGFGGFNIHIAGDELREAADLAGHLGEEHEFPSGEGVRNVARRIPLGVVGVISPWNAPLILSSRSVAPALALGNAVVLKPDPNSPVCGGLVFARLLEEAGLPAGVLCVVPGGADAGEALVEDPNVKMISFTGSTAVGRRVGEIAGRTLKKVALELGGNSPLVILDDADLDAAASNGAWGSFLHQGQICMATSRHLVHSSIAEEYAAKIAEKAAHLPVGDPTGEVALGPLINEKQLSRVRRIVDESVAKGARVVAGGGNDELFFEPTVLVGVTPGMPAFDEEIFGPVVAITTFETDDEAVELANDTEYGLSAAVITADVGRGQAIAERIHSGIVHVNDQTVNDETRIPFGGVGASGNASRFGTLSNVEEFTQWRWMTVKDEPARYPF